MITENVLHLGNFIFESVYYTLRIFLELLDFKLNIGCRDEKVVFFYDIRYFKFYLKCLQFAKSENVNFKVCSIRVKKKKKEKHAQTLPIYIYIYAFTLKETFATTEEEDPFPWRPLFCPTMFVE